MQSLAGQHGLVIGAIVLMGMQEIGLEQAKHVFEPGPAVHINAEYKRAAWRQGGGEAVKRFGQLVNVVDDIEAKDVVVAFFFGEGLERLGQKTRVGIALGIKKIEMSLILGQQRVEGIYMALVERDENTGGTAARVEYHASRRRRYAGSCQHALPVSPLAQQIHIVVGFAQVGPPPAQFSPLSYLPTQVHVVCKLWLMYLCC